MREYTRICDMKRFLLIGLDGFDPLLAKRWMDEGALPHLAGLRSHGSFMPLRSTFPPATLPAWTSCVTGVNPGQHGVFDFTELVPGTYAIRFIHAGSRQTPTIWESLSSAGKRVGILGIPGTYPPQPVNGFMVSGFDSPVCTRIDRSFVWPLELYPEVAEWRFADFQETRIGPGWHERTFQKLMKGIAVKEAIACQQYRKEPWDFFMVVFGESDTVAHHFWMFHDPKSPRHRPGMSDAIKKVYMRLDQAVGRLLDIAETDVAVGVVSDHGFGGAGTGVLHLNNWLAEQGYLCFNQAGGTNRLKAAALAMTPSVLQGALFRRFSGLAANAESKSRFGGIDWAHTCAFSEELNYFPSIRVNLAGREPCGQVPSEEYDAFCETLCAKLEAWEPVKNAWRRKELYGGMCTDRAPDIILELNLEDGYSYSCLRSHGGSSMRRLCPDELVGGKERGMNGNHRPEGVLFTSWPLESLQDPCITDIAPMVLKRLGVPGEESLVQRVDSIVGYTAEQERVVEERLRSMGYLE